MASFMKRIFKAGLGALLAGVLSLLCIMPAISQTFTNLNGPFHVQNAADVAVSNDGSVSYGVDLTGIYLSTNGGTAWSQTGSEVTSPLVVTCRPDTPGTVVVGVGGKLYYSTSSGSSTWSASTITGTPLRLSTSTLNSLNMYAGTVFSSPGNSIYCSTNGGAAWSAVSSSNFPDTTNVNDLYPSTSSSLPDEVWLGGSDPNGAAEGSNPNSAADRRGVWLSTNQGTNWTGENMGSYNVSSIGKSYVSNYVYAGTASGKLFYTTNEGTSWAQLTGYSGASSVHLVRTRTDSDRIYVASNIGLHVTTNDGSSWTAITPNSSDANILALAISPSSQLTMYATTANAVYKTTNAGSSWTEQDTGYGRMPVSSVAINGTSKYTSSKNYPVAGYFNGTSWSVATLSSGFVGEDALYNAGPGKVFITGSLSDRGALFSSSDGVTYSQITVNSGSMANTSSDFLGIRIDPATSTTMYVFGLDSSSGSKYPLFESTNSGSTWSFVTTSAQSKMVDFAIDSTGNAGSWSKIFYAAYGSGGLYYTSNGGSTWSHILSTVSVSSIALNPAAHTTVYVAALQDSSKRRIRAPRGGRAGQIL
jgi:photosystem II stability/assembly factor-like uncharacterized protein